jgi:hypothetical protein
MELYHQTSSHLIILFAERPLAFHGTMELASEKSERNLVRATEEHTLGQAHHLEGFSTGCETPRQNKKQYGAGLIHWVSGKLYWATSDHKDNALFRSVLVQLVPTDVPKPDRKIYVVVDNYRIHFAKAVQAWLLAHQDEVELVCLPTYSPQLNPVERFWKHLRRQVTHNHFFQTMERLMDAVISFFREMADTPDRVCRVTGLAA